MQANRRLKPRGLMIEEAAVRVDRVLAWTDSRGLLRLPPELGGVRLAWCHRQELILRVADRLEGTPVESLAGRCLGHLWRVKEVLRRSRVHSWGGLEGLGRKKGIASALFLPAEPGHLLMLKPVARAFREFPGCEGLWLLARARETGISSLEPGEAVTVGDFGFGWVSSLRPALSALRKWRRDSRAEGVSAEDPLVTATLNEVVAAGLSRLLPFSYSLESILRKCSPGAIVLGNPSTLEGRVGRELAPRSGLPTIAIQHGTLFPRDPLSRDLLISRMCVWGSAGKETLLGWGVPSDQIMVTGDPHERPVRESLSVASDSAREEVLVALSGPGHSVGQAEHGQLVKLLVTAAKLDCAGRWRVRLHRKESRQLYDELLAREAVPNLRIESARETTESLEDRLGQSAVLVTTTSTAAAEALLAGVPVVTMARPVGEMVPDFVAVGATTHVPAQARVLADAVRAIRERGPAPDVAAAASRYVEAFFGPRDGLAARRIAKVILDVCRMDAMPPPGESPAVLS